MARSLRICLRWQKKVVGWRRRIIGKKMDDDIRTSIDGRKKGIQEDEKNTWCN